MVSTSRKNVANKKTLFSLDRNSDSNSQNERLVKKTRFRHAEKLLSPVEINFTCLKSNRIKWFPIV